MSRVQLAPWRGMPCEAISTPFFDTLFSMYSFALNSVYYGHASCSEPV